MKVLAGVLALAALSTATPHLHHRHIHQKKSPMPDMNEALTSGLPSLPAIDSNNNAAAAAVAPAAVASQAVAAVANTASSLTSAAGAVVADISSRLGQLGCKAGRNLNANNGAVWIGNDGQWTNTFTNSGAQDIVLVVWGDAGSWVNAVQPHITHSLPAGQSLTVSFADGQSGGWAGIYPDTASVNGQISNTWGEYTFKAPYSTVDVSREVKMSGHSMSITTPTCVTNMDTCVFVCTDGSDSCWLSYALKNCANGSQQGATYGTFAGAPSGGCSGMGSSAHLTTTLS